MGCKEIYLLGVDCNYTGVKDHAFSYQASASQQKEYADLSELLNYRMQCAYKVARKYADEHGIKIYNATRGGKLEAFERVCA